MTVSIFCPLCQRKNKSDATHCTYCGVQFIVSATDALTTERIAKGAEEAILSGARCAEYLDKRSSDSIALFVMDESEPIVVPNTPQVIVGRHVESSTIPIVDLTTYGGLERGVSRRHIQISYLNGMHTVADLGSTNGTWLNRVRLAPGKPYELHNNDRLILGQLRIVACVPSEESVTDGVFYIKDIRSDYALPEQFTPSYMASVISPFLQAVIDVQHISQDYQGHTTRGKVYINEVKAMKDQPLILANLHGVDEAIRVIQTWVIPWKQSNANKIAPVLTAEDEAHLMSHLQGLARTILSELAPDASAIAINEYIPKLLRPLSSLVSSPLVLTIMKQALA